MVCKKHLWNQVKEKEDQEGLESLTETERKIATADESELDEVVPENYGPASDYDGDYCKFCYWVGRLGAAVTGAAIALVLFWFVSRHSGLVNEQQLYASGGALVLGFLAWVYLDRKVKVKGYFPVLGPRLGPIVERLFAAIGIHVTATARRKYAQEQPVSDGGVDVIDGEDYDLKTNPDVDEHELPDNYFDAQEQAFRQKLQRLRDKKESLEESLRNERGEKIELKNELEETQQEINTVKQAKKKKEEEISNYKEKMEELDTKIQHLSDWGHAAGDSDRQRNRIPVTRHGNGATVGIGKWLVKVVEVRLDDRMDFHEPAKFAFCVDSPGEDIPSHIPEVITDWKRYEDYLYPHPDNVKNPAKFVHPGEAGYPNVDLTDRPINEYPEVLFHSDLSKVRAERQRMEEEREVGSLENVGAKLAYDKDGNYVPPSFDIRGFESLQEQRNLAQKRYRHIRMLESQLEQKEECVEDLRHAVTVLENQLDLKDGFLQDARDQARGATEAAMLTEQQTEQARRGVEYMKHQNHHNRELWEEANEQLRNVEEERIKDNAELSQTVEEYNNMDQRKRNSDKLFQAIWGLGWESAEKEFDFEKIEAGESEHSKEDVISQLRHEVEQGIEQDKAFDRLFRNHASDVITNGQAGGDV